MNSLKKVLSLATALLLPLTLGAIPAQAAQLPTVWTTVVDDTFTGTTLPSHWRSYNGRYGSGADHNCAAPSHSTVAGGYLHMKMFYEPAAVGVCGPAWYSAGLTLDRTLSAPKQRITTTFRVVETSGIQAHRIIPMLSANDGTGIGEQDWCESTPISFCSTFLHFGDPPQQNRMKYFLDLSQWHTFVVARDDYHVTTSIDGVAKMDFTGTETTLPSRLKHVVLQQECNKLGCPSTHVGTEDIQVDRIMVENGV